MPLLVIAGLLFVTNAPAQIQVSEAETRGRAVVAAMREGNFAAIEQQFTDQMQTALPPGRLAAVWTGLVAQAGALKTCADASRVRTIGDKRMVITACDFDRAKVDVQVAFDATGHISGFAIRPAATPPIDYTPPSYAKADSYSEAEITIGDEPWRLPGTLTLPKGDGPFPAVVLVHGSGPSDRDETIGSNKPFKDLALGLASKGIAVVRYDKRTKVHPEKLAASPSFTVNDETVLDAIEAAKTLRSTPRIDPARIYVAGHSLGAMMIPRIAAKDPRLAGVVVMAGAASAVEDLIVAQTKYLAGGDAARVADAEKLAATIKGLKPADAGKPGLVGGAPASYWVDLQDYDPPVAAKRVTQRMLILQGERDYQVPMTEFAKWKVALNGKPSVTFKSYPALNHLFIAGAGQPTPQEYETPSHVAAEVVDDIAAWMLRR